MKPIVYVYKITDPAPMEKMKSRTRKKYKNLVSREIFNDYLNGEGNLKVTCQKIRRYRKCIQKLRQRCLTFDPDYRSGHETYGYDSLESIENSLSYICDRFSCTFRLTWLINVPEEVDKILLSSSNPTSEQ